MKKILITYFEPFGKDTDNVSKNVGELISERIGNIEIEKCLLPVEFSRAADIALERVRETGAFAVISLGQAGARRAVTPEMAALNLRYATIPDNAGRRPLDEPCIAGAPNAYFSTLPVRQMAGLISECGVPCTVSYSAGTYVCNDLYFRLLHGFANTEIKAAFVHLPKESEGVSALQMAKALEKMIEGIFCA